MRNKTVSTSLSILLAIILAFNVHVFASSSAIYQGGQLRNVSSFNELKLSISANVYLKQGTEQKVEIHASDRLLELIETEVKAGALIIKWTKNNVSHSEKIKIYITMKEVNALMIAGSGNIVANGLISTSNLELKISGSGNINLADVKADKISSKISGSADISIKGNSTVSELQVSISGSGDVKADGIPANDVVVSISGSGDCKVNALGTLKAKVAGSGDIYYKGGATIDGKVAGSGTIKHIN